MAQQATDRQEFWEFLYLWLQQLKPQMKGPASVSQTKMDLRIVGQEPGKA